MTINEYQKLAMTTLNKELDEIMENHYKRINDEESAHQSSQ